MEPTIQEFYCTYLKEEGFPKSFIDEKGAVIFKCEGKTYVIHVDPDIPARFSLLLPSFWEPEDADEVHRALTVCDEVNVTLHGVKVFCVHHDVSATVELFLSNPAEDIKDIFHPSLQVLQGAYYLFVSRMHKKQPPKAPSGGGTPVPAHTSNGVEITPGYL